MSENEKQENLANARRKLKKFRDQQPNHIQTNGNDVHSTNGTSDESTINYNIIPQTVTGFVNEQQSIFNGNQSNFSTSPIIEVQQTRLENQQRLNSGSSMSGRTSQTLNDIEQKLRRDIEHLQEQLEVHVQTIGILVAEKTDVSAKLSQSFKQLERKQSEMDELHGRLKASRERVQELEKDIQNSTSNVQKREMAAKESDKENDRLKIENIRQSQLIEDLKQNINDINDKLHNKQNIIDQLNHELEQFKNQSQSTNEISITEQQTIRFKDTQIEELIASINRLRSDNEQYQEYNLNMQHHIQELDNQINQLNEKNHLLQTEYDQMKKTYSMKLFDQNLTFNYENFQQENQLLRNAIDQWINRYEDLKLKLEQMTKLLTEKDERIIELQTNMNNFKDSIDTKQISKYLEQEIQTEEQLTFLTNDDQQSQQQDFIKHYNETMHENIQLKDRILNLEHIIQQLQSETETIGDYIHLYQQQREQLQKRYQEKDDQIQQLTQDRFYLQKKVSELENLFVRSLDINQSKESNNSIVQSELNEQSEMIDNVSLPTTNEQTISLNIDKTSNSSSLPQLSDQTKARILILIKELGLNIISSTQNENLSTVKSAFVDKNLYICSTCSGPVQWV